MLQPSITGSFKFNKKFLDVKHIVPKTSNTLLFVTIILLSLFVAVFPSYAKTIPSLLYEIKIPMEPNEYVTVQTNDGMTALIGQVVALPKTTRWPSYSASAWGTPGEVCASAVNAVHMLVSVEKEKGRTLSLIPAKLLHLLQAPALRW